MHMIRSNGHDNDYGNTVVMYNVEGRVKSAVIIMC